jgi:hypothetical protein
MAVVGQWSGTVDADAGQMPIQVTVSASAGKFTGSITSPHGKWTIDGGTFEKGRWRLPFKGEAGQGYLAGSMVSGRFTGEWNNVGVARGTFDLGRVKQ